MAKVAETATRARVKVRNALQKLEVRVDIWEKKEKKRTIIDGCHSQFSPKFDFFWEMISIKLTYLMQLKWNINTLKAPENLFNECTEEPLRQALE